MKPTLFVSPWVRAVMTPISRLGIFFFGWHFEGEFPKLRKYVLIGAPHTSNWDFVFMLFAAFILKQDFRWMGKDSIFKFPFGGLARWAGGISIDRSHQDNRVQKMIETFNEAEDLILVIAPEGTRSKREKWKTGFYHIALGAGVPVLPCWLDYGAKVGGIGQPYWLTGGQEKDLRHFQDLYRPQWAKYPELYTPPLGEPEPKETK